MQVEGLHPQTKKIGSEVLTARSKCPHTFSFHISHPSSACTMKIHLTVTDWWQTIRFRDIIAASSSYVWLRKIWKETGFKRLAILSWSTRAYTSTQQLSDRWRICIWVQHKRLKRGKDFWWNYWQPWTVLFHLRRWTGIGYSNLNWWNSDIGRPFLLALVLDEVLYHRGFQYDLSLVTVVDACFTERIQTRMERSRVPCIVFGSILGKIDVVRQVEGHSVDHAEQIRSANLEPGLMKTDELWISLTMKTSGMASSKSMFLEQQQNLLLNFVMSGSWESYRGPRVSSLTVTLTYALPVGKSSCTSFALFILHHAVYCKWLVSSL